MVSIGMWRPKRAVNKPLEIITRSKGMSAWLNSRCNSMGISRWVGNYFDGLMDSRMCLMIVGDLSWLCGFVGDVFILYRYMLLIAISGSMMGIYWEVGRIQTIWVEDEFFIDLVDSGWSRIHHLFWGLWIKCRMMTILSFPRVAGCANVINLSAKIYRIFVFVFQR